MSPSRLFIPPGRKFGYLTVLREGPTEVSGGQLRRSMICSCECGTAEVVVRVDCLTQGRTRSCGCMRAESMKRAAAASLKHGLRNHPLYSVWVMLRRRANDRRSPEYAAGICQAWMDDVRVFIREVEAEIGLRPPGGTLSRKDEEQDFEPGNIRWITHAEQIRRRRSVARLASRITELEIENRRLTSLVETLRQEVEMYQLYGR